jgi:hypothetical protein
MNILRKQICQMSREDQKRKITSLLAADRFTGWDAEGRKTEVEALYSGGQFRVMGAGGLLWEMGLDNAAAFHTWLGRRLGEMRQGGDGEAKLGEEQGGKWSLSSLEDLPKDGTKVWIADEKLGYAALLKAWWDAGQESFVAELPLVGVVVLDLDNCTRKAGWIHIPKGWSDE